MKVLSIEQMTKLKELGVDTSIASMAIYDIYAGENKVYDIIASNGAFPEDQEYDRFGYGIHSAVAFCKKPVFTLQDVIELTPSKIKIEESDYLLKIYTSSSRFSYEIVSDPLCGDYDPFEEIVFRSNNIIDAAYKMLIWVIENNYLKTK